jgi:hypothetical protein
MSLGVRSVNIFATQTIPIVFTTGNPPASRPRNANSRERRDCPLERTGFEPPVPLLQKGSACLPANPGPGMKTETS